MTKSCSSAALCGTPTAEDMALIGKYALRPLDKSEVFTFSVVLCDNEIDRDLERFSDSTLYELKELFEGKTGIFNHSMDSRDQSARAFRTEVINDPQKKTSDGRAYKYLKAWCYTVRGGENDALIRDIEAGIKKEVSIGCAVKRRVCSICGETECEHSAGRSYSGKSCHKILEGATDAYEWSFVAVPAQKNAGVTKSYKKEKNMEGILKALKEQKQLNLSGKEAQKLYEYISRLEKDGELAKRYREELDSKAKKYFALTLPSLDEAGVEEILNSLDTETAEKLCRSLEKQAQEILPSAPQLFKEQTAHNPTVNGEFKI